MRLLPPTSLPSRLRVVREGPTREAGAGLDLEVKFAQPAASVPIFRSALKDVLASQEEPEDVRLERLEALTATWREEATTLPGPGSRRRGWPPEDRQKLLAALLVIADLVRQGCTLSLGPRGPHFRIDQPLRDDEDPSATKARIRHQELLRREEQLSRQPVRDFIRSLERRRLHNGSFVSVLSLVRDGRALGSGLHEALALPETERGAALDRLVQPYLQFVDDQAQCEYTGLRLMDVWRYFRHTWANQYVSVPGRTMQFLVRDRAAPYHPVIGICALSSPIVQIRERDLWVGWHPERFLADVRAAPSDQVARWLVQTVEDALRDVYVQDFLEDGTLTVTDLHTLSPSVAARLAVIAKEERERHHRFASAREQKRAPRRTEEDWVALARTSLYKSKRALALLDLLEARSTLQRFFGGRPTKARLADLLDDPDGSRVVARVLRKAKADRVGILMADISVCGALPPYNALLGGKLVAMLATSPEVVQEYRRRYGGAVSEIASGTAGRPVQRQPDLALLATTSLYGNSSQYNRISIPCERLGGVRGSVVRYHETGRSEAYGTSHFSEETVEALSALVSQSENGVRVNSIFGEGQSPKLRKIRDGLDLLGFPSDPLLRHGRRRVVYCIPLVHNVRDFLIGLDSKPDYLVPQGSPRERTEAIVQWWRERWMRPRALRPETAAAIDAHTLVYPIRHGAKVTLPDMGQRELFE